MITLINTATNTILTQEEASEYAISMNGLVCYWDAVNDELAFAKDIKINNLHTI